jgi:hypothetical protein
LSAAVGPESITAADLNNDGNVDLVVANFSGSASVALGNGDGTFQKIVRGSLVNDNGEGAGAAWADFNRDGFPDLFVLTNGVIEFHRCQNCGCVTHWAPVDKGYTRMGVNMRLFPPEVLAQLAVAQCDGASW